MLSRRIIFLKDVGLNYTWMPEAQIKPLTEYSQDGEVRPLKYIPRGNFGRLLEHVYKTLNKVI